MTQQTFNEGSIYGDKMVLPNATPVLVLGIISIIGCFCYGIVGIICGIIALVLAKKDLTRYRQAPEQYTRGSYDNLNAGKVCAIIGLCLSVLFLAYVIVAGSILLNNPELINKMLKK